MLFRVPGRVDPGRGAGTGCEGRLSTVDAEPDGKPIKPRPVEFICHIVSDAFGALAHIVLNWLQKD